MQGEVISPILSSGSTLPNARSMTQNTVDVDGSDGEGIPFANVQCNEDDIRKVQILDIVKIIVSLRLTSNDLCRMKIPLCRLIPMPIVRPTLSSDLIALENQFSRGYEEGARVFYVSISDEESKQVMFSDEEKEEWGPLWNEVNNEFNQRLRAGPLAYLVDYKFFVCDGNHRRIAWMNHIERLYSTDREWHVCVDSIILDTRNRIGVTMQAMHDINKYVSSSLQCSPVNIYCNYCCIQ